MLFASFQSLCTAVSSGPCSWFFPSPFLAVTEHVWKVLNEKESLRDICSQSRERPRRLFASLPRDLAGCATPAFFTPCGASSSLPVRPSCGHTSIPRESLPQRPFWATCLLDGPSRSLGRGSSLPHRIGRAGSVLPPQVSSSSRPEPRAVSVPALGA